MILSSFSPPVFSFGDLELTEKMLYEQIAVALVFFFPVAILVGQVSLRFAVRSPVPSLIRVDVWNAVFRLLVSDLIVEGIQFSFQCIPFEDLGDDYQELFYQSIGIGCPLYAKFLHPRSMSLVFSLRVLAVAAGLYLGEGWMPVAMTGGIASGKSTVAKQLLNGASAETDDDDDKKDDEKEERQPVPVDEGTVFLVDADQIGHDVLQEASSGNVYHKLVAEFGDGILADDDTTIDRAKLGSKIFGSSDKRKKLNSITHPQIIKKMMQKICWGLYCSFKHITIADVPLLYEVGFLTRLMFVVTVVVNCSPEEQLERLQARNPNLTKAECKARIDSQMPLAEKAKRADIVVDNSGDLKSLEEQVEEARYQIMYRLYGVGLTVFQIVLIMGLSMPVAIMIKIYREGGFNGATSSGDGGGMDDGMGTDMGDDIPMDHTGL